MCGMKSTLCFSLYFILFMHNVHSSIWPTYEFPSKLHCSEKAAVSTDTPVCAPVGEDILRRNGSAVDAAIAMLLCNGANNPQSSGLGGGFFMVYYNRSEKKSYFLNSREVAPRKAYKRYDSGPRSIAVPGELAGFEEAHSLFGQLPWKELFTPTIKMCHVGLLITKHFEGAIQLVPKEKKIRVMKKDSARAIVGNGFKFISVAFNALLDNRNATRCVMKVFSSPSYYRKIFQKKNGEEYKAGDRMKRPKLAKTLAFISRAGKKALYGTSTMFYSFLRDLKAAGSLIGKMDLRRYKPRFRNSLKINLRNRITLHTASFPSSGVLVAMMLGILDGYPDLSKNVSKDDNLAAKCMHRVIEVCRYAAKYKYSIEDSDSDEAKKFMTKLTSKAYLDRLRSQINDKFTHKDIFTVDSNKRHGKYSSTTHVSVIAPNGDAVAATSSINRYFGSYILSPSTGILLNNHIADFDSDKSDVKNSVRSGRSPRSAMSPSIFTDAEGNVKLVVGSAGGFRILTTVMQIAARVLFFDEDLKTSMDAPRLHVEKVNEVEFEENFPMAMRNRLRHFGHTQQLQWKGRTVATSAMRTNKKQGCVCSVADYRKELNVMGLYSLNKINY